LRHHLYPESGLNLTLDTSPLAPDGFTNEYQSQAQTGVHFMSQNFTKKRNKSIDLSNPRLASLEYPFILLNLRLENQ
jgi:hypothetical protein